MLSLLALDIETAPNWALIEAHPAAFKKFCERRRIEDPSMAALHPQWGKITCVGVGRSLADIDAKAGASETEILSYAATYLDSSNCVLVGHNIFGFDLGYLSFRYLANSHALPKALRTYGRKPWEVIHIDTQKELQFLGTPSRCSLADACTAFGLPSPKANMDGAAAATTTDYVALAEYCRGDVAAVINLYSRLRQCGYLPPLNGGHQ